MPQKNWQLYPFSTKIELENISLICKQIAASNIKYSSLYQIDISTKLKSCQEFSIFQLLILENGLYFSRVCVWTPCTYSLEKKVSDVDYIEYCCHWLSDFLKLLNHHCPFIWPHFEAVYGLRRYLVFVAFDSLNATSANL